MSKNDMEKYLIELAFISFLNLQGFVLTATARILLTGEKS